MESGWEARELYLFAKAVLDRGVSLAFGGLVLFNPSRVRVVG